MVCKSVECIKRFAESDHTMTVNILPVLSLGFQLVDNCTALIVIGLNKMRIRNGD